MDRERETERETLPRVTVAPGFRPVPRRRAACEHSARTVYGYINLLKKLCDCYNDQREKLNAFTLH